MNSVNYKQTVAQIRRAERQGVIRAIKVVVVATLFLMVGVGLFEWLTGGRADAPLAWHIERAAGMFLVIIGFLAFKFTTEKSMYEVNIGRLIIERYTKKLALDRPTVVPVEALQNLNGKTYNQLDEKDKALLAKAVLDGAYSYFWVFSDKDLAKVAKTEGTFQLNKILASSAEEIKVSEKWLLRRHKRAYFR